MIDQLIQMIDELIILALGGALGWFGKRLDLRLRKRERKTERTEVDKQQQLELASGIDGNATSSVCLATNSHHGS